MSNNEPRKLNAGEVNFLRLTAKGQDEHDGWAPVSKPVMTLMRAMPGRLVEVEDMPEGRGRARLTPEGESVLNAMGWLQ